MRSAAQNLRYFSQQTTNTTFAMVQHNSRCCYSFSCYSPHPFLFSDCQSSIITSRRIESMIDRLPPSLLACLPIQTHIHRKSHVSVCYKMDAQQHNTSSKAKDTTHLLQLELNPSLACQTHSCVPSFVVHSAQLSGPARPGQPTEEQKKSINH